MKFPLLVLFLCVTTLAQSKESPARPSGVPDGATMEDGNTWRWVDGQRKAWLYRNTPFGMMKSEEPAQIPLNGKRPAAVPAGAKQIGEAVWRWVDPQGKAWLYQETPAGVMKSEEPKGAEASVGPTGQKVADDRADAVLNLMSAKDEGENVRFSRPGPFGTYSWVKKKTQLDQDETKVWERAQAKAGSAKKD